MADEIQEQYKQLMNMVANSLDRVFNGEDKGTDRKVIFTLLIADAGQIEGGRVNYISNGQRDDVVSMMHEILARFEGRYSPQEGSA